MAEENQIVFIKWTDARIFTGQFSKEDALSKRAQVFNSVGYLVDKNPTITKIAHEITDDGEYRDILLIPTGSIINMKVLGVTP